MKQGLIYCLSILLLAACRNDSPEEIVIGQSLFPYSPPVTVLLDSRPPAKTTELNSKTAPRVVQLSAASLSPSKRQATVPPTMTKAKLPISSFTHFGTEQGLALSTIACGWVDRTGNLWFGTAGGGVSRFDGTEFKTFTTRQGLGHNTVRCMVEDKQGNIWFGTNGGGVSRFNGTHFITFTTKQGLTHNAIRALIFDASGNLWIGTEGGGVSRYDGKSFTTFSVEDGLAHNTVWSIAEDRNGNIWFGTDGGLSRFDGESFSTYTVKHGLANDRVRCILQDKKGDFWFGTPSGLSVFDGSSFATITKKQGLVSDFIWRIFEDKSGNLWFGTDEGLSRYDGTTFTDFTTSEGLLNNAILTINEDKSGNLWLGTDGGGISRYEGTNITAYTTAQGLAANIVRCIIEDKRGNLWFATQGGGVSRYDGDMFTTYTTEQGLVSNEVWSMLEDKSGNIWFGSAWNGVSRFDGTNFITYTTDHGLAHNNIKCIAEDSSGYIWIGTEGGGVSRYDGKSFTTFSTEHGLAHNDVRSISEDRIGNLWFSTNGGGVSRFDGMSLTTFTTAQGLPSNVVWSIEEDRSGSLWFGTGSGVCRYDGKSFTTLTTIQGLSNDVVYDIAEDEHGTLWFGTNSGFSGLRYNSLEIEGNGTEIKGAGLLSVDNRVLGRMTPVWETYNIRTGYPVKSIILNAMCISKRGLPFGENRNVGMIWAGCGDNKVIRFDPMGRAANSDHLNAFLHTIKINGTLINWYGLGKWAKDSITLAQQEAMVFGRSLQPVERERICRKFGSLQFDTLSDSHLLPVNLILPYKHNQVTFDFGVIETGRNYLVRYQYMLLGYDTEWSPITEKTSVTYGNIKEGNYEFKLKARSPDREWSEPVVYKFGVLPPWWRSWWAYSVYGLAFVVLIWIARNEAVRRERLKNEIKFKQLEADKYQELDVLKSRFFANISHEFRTPLTLLLSPLEKYLSKATAPQEKVEFEIMHRNASRLLNLVNQLLDLSRIEAGSLKLKMVQGNLNTFINSISSQFSSMAQSRNIHFEVVAPSELDSWFDPDKLEKIIINLLSNAFKFTPPGGSIGVTISKENGYARIEIFDSGAGIPPDKIDRIFNRFYQVDDSNIREYEGSGIGLSLVKELVELHGGTISVTSNPGEGSRFTLKIPLISQRPSAGEIGEAGEWNATSSPRTAETSAVPSKFFSNDELPRVLIVEDNDDLRNYLLLSLGDRYSLSNAANGQLGLELAIREIPDLILSDLMMPNMDGLQLCREIKLNEKTSHIPLILLTAKADGETRIDGLETGADDYLAKPFNLPELIARINNLIESRKKLRKLFTSSIILKPSEIKAISLDDKFIKKVMESMEAHLADSTFSVEVLADEVAMSSVQLYRKLKAITGQTPNDLIRNIRLERAASLLDQRAGNVADVAYLVGFNNLSYFAKCFKDKFHMSPSEYLKKNISKV